MVTVRTSADAVAKALEAAKARVADLAPAMKAAEKELNRVWRSAVHADTSPDGTPWPALADKTLERRKRKGKASKKKPTKTGLRPLRGDTAQMLGQMFVASQGNTLTFGSKAKSKKGFPYFMAHQFGATTKGTFKARRYVAASDGERLVGPLRPGMARRRDRSVVVRGEKGAAWEKNIPRRAFFPVDELGGKLVPMTGGKADAFYEKLKRAITRYITKGKT